MCHLAGVSGLISCCTQRRTGSRQNRARAPHVCRQAAPPEALGNPAGLKVIYPVCDSNTLRVPPAQASCAGQAVRRARTPRAARPLMATWQAAPATHPTRRSRRPSPAPTPPRRRPKPSLTVPSCRQGATRSRARVAKRLPRRKRAAASRAAATPVGRSALTTFAQARGLWATTAPRRGCRRCRRARLAGASARVTFPAPALYLDICVVLCFLQSITQCLALMCCVQCSSGKESDQAVGAGTQAAAPRPASRR